MNKDVSIVIPSFNARNLLEENLPVLIRHSCGEPNLKEIIIVDDCSNDGTVGFLSKNFPQVKVIRLAKNSGFSSACNAGARQAKSEIIYFLNSDIKVSAGFLAPLLTHFEQDDVFAVSSVETRGTDPTGIPLVKFKFGIFWYWYAGLPADSLGLAPIEVFCVSGGHSAYNREKFLGLGGFDPIFSPIYAEDGDICWRAWKRGLRSLVEPKSKVTHECRGTMRKFYSAARLLRAHWKNRFLMTWKNITARGLLIKHLLFLVPELLICPLMGRGEFTAGFFLALKQLPELLKARKRDRPESEVYSDNALFRRFSRLPVSPPFKILYLHDSSNISGAEQSLLHLITWLDKDLFRPMIILPKDGAFVKELNSSGVEADLLAFPRIRTIWGVFSALRKIRKLARDRGAHLLHSNGIRTNMYAAIAGRLENIPVIWHQRNLITNEVVDTDRLFSFLPDKIICNSYAIARRLLRKSRLPDNVKVVYNGVDIARFNPGVSGSKIREEFAIKPQEVVIGIASRHGPDKGHETFLKAAQMLSAYGLDSVGYRFLIAGDAVFQQDRWREKYLKELVSGLGLAKRLVFTGFRKDMPEIYAAMDIFVLASDAEPCGRVLLEAMASGKPVVATNSGGTPEIVRDQATGYLVSPKDPKAMADKIFLLVKNPELAKRMGEESRKRIEACFRIETNVRQIEKIYLGLLENEQK